MRLQTALKSVFWMLVLPAICASFPASVVGGETVVISYDKAPAVHFAAEEIAKALEENGFTVAKRVLKSTLIDDERTQIVLMHTKSGLVKEQGYAITVKADGSEYCVVGGGAAGAMYGGLDVAETIRFDKDIKCVKPKVHNPSIEKRGIKFNIPLDARTPSYDDTGDAAQNNYVQMWNFDFWEQFLDDMARYRYNTLTLWNPHPFPSIVKCPDYPDAALEDICVTTLKPTYKSGAWRDPQFVSPKVLANLKIAKKMSMDEKIAFWRRVMKRAKDRGIDMYFITWNVLMNSVEGKYGVTNDQDNPRTIAYLRQCVRETILTYPDLAGIGVTAGENMRNRNDEYDREKWLWRTYGLGVMDAKKIQPDRTVRFIHRVWNTGLDKIMNDFGAKYPGPFEIGFKYARAHMYSSPKPPFAGGLLKEMQGHDVKCWWNLRNDDIFNFRWGDPEYVRAFLGNLPPADKTAGYHMGSDGYVWGREFTSLEPESPRQLEIQKHWYSFMLWGRLGYDLGLDKEYMVKAVGQRFPETSSEMLYETWRSASMIIPQVNRFHWQDWDFMWAVEGCFDQRNGFHTVRDFIKTRPMQESGIISIGQYVDAVLDKSDISATTPLQVADRLVKYADVSLKNVQVMRSRRERPGKELRLTLCDIEAMSHLGLYYAAKIRGAAELCFFDKTKKAEHKKAAVNHLLEAQKHWERYADVAAGLYRPQLLARTRVLDWKVILEDVKKDVDIARSSAAAR